MINGVTLSKISDSLKIRKSTNWSNKKRQRAPFIRCFWSGFSGLLLFN